MDDLTSQLCGDFHLDINVLPVLFEDHLSTDIHQIDFRNKPH